MVETERQSTILIVDDELAVMQSITELLQLETPYRVLGETRPSRALQLAKVEVTRAQR